MKKTELLKFIEDEVSQIVKTEKSKPAAKKSEPAKPKELKEEDFDEVMFKKINENKRIRKIIDKIIKENYDFAGEEKSFWDKKYYGDNLEKEENDLIEYEVPEWSLSALINGDYSALSDEEENKLNKFIKQVSSKHGNANFMLGDIENKDNLGFKHKNDIDNLGSDVYVLYIKPSKLNESKEQHKVYHNTFSAACSEVIDFAKEKGYEVDEDDWFNKVSVGSKKPSDGQTNRYSIELKKEGKLQKKMLHFQVYGMKGGKYELNAYIN